MHRVMNVQHSPATLSVETILCHKWTFHLIKRRICGHSPHRSNIHFFAKKSLCLSVIFNLTCSKQLHKKALRSENRRWAQRFFSPGLHAAADTCSLLETTGKRKKKKKTTMWKGAIRPRNSWDWFSLTQYLHWMQWYLTETSQHPATCE